MRYLILALSTVVLTGYQPVGSADVTAVQSAQSAPAPIPDMHGSRDSLDWAGHYEGLLACEDCAGIQTRLTLEPDGRFAIETRRLVRDAKPSSAQGRFAWEPNGNIIVLDPDGSRQRFAVGEGRLLPLETGQTQPAWDQADAGLARSSPAGHGAQLDLGDMLGDHRWILVDATDAANRRIDSLFPDDEHGFVLHFAESRLHAQGGCNGLRAGFGLDAQGMLELTGRMSTMMSCAAPLMEADEALARLMAEPLESVLVRGVQPTLVLLTTGGDALVFQGELTPEARLGAPTRVFLEVAADRVECDQSVLGDGQCLQVRELTFDEQGLRKDTASEWRVLTVPIEGYQHQPGIRNILRLKRFEPTAGSDQPTGAVYVLDLVVESEVMSR